jgi:hypothetical protein
MNPYQIYNDIEKMIQCSYFVEELNSQKAMKIGNYLFEKIKEHDQELKDKLEQYRKDHCELFYDGCKDSAGCCDVCAVVEDIQELFEVKNK